MTKGTATALGFLAVLLWALLALFTAASGAVPPFQLAAMTFAIAAISGGAVTVWRGTGTQVFRIGWRAWAVGVGGLFGYHFLYFSALRNAPPVEASLIAYLWPLMIVVFSALLPGERLGWHHVVGALMGLAGAVLIVTDGGTISPRAIYIPGYLMALTAAFFWTGYSLLSRRLAGVPTEAVTGFCAATALLAALCHLGLETTAWPQTPTAWLAILGLGLGPVGLAFFVWDLGVKRGDIQVLGAASYTAPLLSTILLVALGFAEATRSLALACILITGGAALAAKDMLTARKDIR